MARLERLRVYPIKGLDGVDVDRAAIRPGGTLAYDREYALFDAAGEVINGKRTARVHDLETAFDPATGTYQVTLRGGETRQFTLPDETDAAETWFSAVFDADLTLERDTSLGYVDRRSMGPSVISTATLETVAGWFDDLSVAGMRRRLRANVEVAGVPAFWEDRFAGPDVPTFSIGDIGFEGVTPCGRCVVPERDPDTGDHDASFRERFIERREATFPAWADPDAFDHYYTLMLIARIPEADRNGTLHVGDPVDPAG